MEGLQRQEVQGYCIKETPQLGQFYIDWHYLNGKSTKDDQSQNWGSSISKDSAYYHANGLRFLLKLLSIAS